MVFSFMENTIFFNKKTMFSYLEKGISQNIWSCDVVSASDIDLLRIFMCFCIIFVISAPFSHHFLLHFDVFCSFTATSHLTTTASEMLCTKAFQETCGSVAANFWKLNSFANLDGNEKARPYGHAFLLKMSGW